jgi:hypothetical protein
MARKPCKKELVHSRIASGYGGWIYCDQCGENIGYLCYVTYDHFMLEYKCKCGGSGYIYIAFDDVKDAQESDEQLIGIKNRLCCPKDQSPLLTILEKKLTSYQYEIECVGCKTKYKGSK